MRTIWKFNLGAGTTIHEMPKGAKVLSIGWQNGVAVIWLLVDPSAPKVRRGFWLVGTGNQLSAAIEGFAFVGTLVGTPFVWHVFDAGEREIETSKITSNTTQNAPDVMP